MSRKIGTIGIGRGLAASPLPHHRTYGSRIRRFGRLSQGEPSPQPQPPTQSASSRFIPDAGRTARHLAGCHLAAPPPATTPVHRSGLRPTRVAAWPIRCPAFRPWGASRASPALGLRCPRLTSVGRSGRIAPPSVLHEDTAQISRGKLSYLPCIDAGFIKYTPPVDGGLYGRVPTRPERTTPHIRFVSLAPHLRSTLPSDPTSR